MKVGEFALWPGAYHPVRVLEVHEQESFGAHHPCPTCRCAPPIVIPGWARVEVKDDPQRGTYETLAPLSMLILHVPTEGAR